MTLLPEGNIQHLWYTRRGDRITGPHPLKQIQRYIILGRINDQDELSTDLENWKPLTDLPEVIPEVVRNADDPETDHRLITARMKEDERKFGDRRNNKLPVDLNRRRNDRRQPESATILEYRKFKTEMIKERQVAKPSRTKETILIMGVISLVITAGWLLTFYPSQVKVNFQPACNNEARPGVDWSECGMQGAQLAGQPLSGSRMRSTNLAGADLTGATLTDSDLSYANLSIANLAGANLSNASLVGTALRQADLTDVNLNGADLSYANLAEADLTGASLANAKLDHAIWVDAKVCQPGSIGKCIPTQETAKSSP